MTAAKMDHSGKRSELPDAVTSMGEAWKASTLDLPLMIWSETLRFMSHRLQAQADHLASLGRCKTVTEAIESQTNFTQKAVSEYVAETGTILNEARSVVKLPEMPKMAA